jgi:hypothetical protein
MWLVGYHSVPAALSTFSCAALQVYGSGPLVPRVGDVLVAEGVPLISMYGGTEFGLPTKVFTTAAGRGTQDWAYLETTNKITSRWIEQGDGSFELQLLATTQVPLAIENLPDARGYATKDVFVPHPSKEGLWKMQVPFTSLQRIKS